MGTPNNWRIQSRASWLVFQLKKIDVFSLFNCCPEAFSYCSRSWDRRSQSLEVALQNNKLSSAKKRWCKRGPLGDDGTPVSQPVCSAFYNIVLRASTHITNRYGERGSPWRIPLEGWNWSVCCPLRSMENWTDLRHCMINSLHFSANPILLITTSKKLHSILSYALLISSFIAKYLVFPQWRVCIECNAS